MANELTSYLQSGQLADVSDQDLAGSLQGLTQDDEGTGQLGFDFMSFSGKTGRYSVGRDKEEVDPGLSSVRTF